MRKSKLTDFTLTTGALVISVSVALLATLRLIETNTALVFVSLSIACVAMSLIDLEATSAKSKKRRK